jgi:imidazole glycerol phosphate synthase glutamine amidotransferase subunit
MIAIFDYGAGNLRSVENTLGEVSASYTLVRDSAGLRKASKIILPGVGHFGQMMRALDTMQVRGTFVECLRGGVPFLGICLGLQALFTASDEAPEVEGLGIFEGRVRRFPKDARVPHMGWNELETRAPSRLLARLDAKPFVYFAHSYYVPETEAAAAVCNYCVPYTAVLDAGNIFGVQFHPEKSGPVGLRIVKNFVEL